MVLGGPPTYLTHPGMLWRHLKGAVVGPRYACVFLTPSKEWLAEMVGKVVHGEVRVDVEQVIDDWKGGYQKGFEKLGEGRTRGKIVVRIQ